MAAAAMKYMASNFSKLDKFEGVDFRRWQKKMYFLLSSMSVVYMLTTPSLEDGENATMEHMRRRNKWENDDYCEKPGHLKKDYKGGKVSSKANGSGTLHGMDDDVAWEVVRLPDLKLKTLGERGIKCIFVGYVEHSKAFRFCVTEPNELVSINSIIELRGDIFHENRFSSVLRPSQRSLINRTEDIGDSKEAINAEMNSIMGNNTWVLADVPPDEKKTFLNGELDEEVYMNQPQGFIMPGNENKEFLSSKFSIKDMGNADVILGIRINHGSNEISISQSHYVEKVLKKFNYFDCIPVSTPIDTSEKLMPNNGQAVSQSEYSRVIGCLMYAITWLDISFVVGKLSRYTSNPSTQHWQAIQRVLKYSKKTIDYSLTSTGYPSVLEGYTNASWISNTEDNSSTNGWVFLLGGGNLDTKDRIFQRAKMQEPVRYILTALGLAPDDFVSKSGITSCYGLSWFDFKLDIVVFVFDFQVILDKKSPGALRISTWMIIG
ncbi:zinc finger, CCHC-type containing protein [Tanacetum coccineum]